MIIIPTYNERGNVAELSARIRKALTNEKILFVDDGSPDGTEEEIKKLQAKDPNILLLERGKKLGFASAHLDGFLFALKANEEYIISMDADLSHPAEVLPEMIERLKEYDLVIGSRYVSGGKVENWPWSRKLLSRFANWYARTLTGSRIFDLTSGFVGYRSEFFQKLDASNIKSKGYAFLVESKYSALQKKPRYFELPITFTERVIGKSKMRADIIWESIKYPIKVFFGRIKKGEPKLVFGLVLFFLTLAVFIATLPRTIYLGDSAEYMMAAKTLGITHPTGNPAYVLLTYLFSLFPISTLAFRVGLASVLFASAGLVVFYLILCKVAKPFVAFIVSLILAFSSLFWSQAIMAKPYAAFFFFTVLILFWLIRYLETDRNWYIPAIMFAFGLGASFHEGLVLFIPLLLFAFAIKLYRISKQGSIFNVRFNLRPFFLGLVLFVLGLSLYLYVPIRAAENPAYDFSRIYRTVSLKNFSGVYNYFLRGDYNDLAQNFGWQDKQLFSASFLMTILQQFSWLLVFAFAGLCFLAFRNKVLLLLTAGIFLLNSVILILIRSVIWSFEGAFLYSFYYLPAIGMVALWIGVGLAESFELINRKIKFKYIFKYILFLLLLIPIFFLKTNFNSNNLHNFSFLQEYSSKLLTSLPPNAVLLTVYDGAVEDSASFALIFQQIASKLRPDVTIMRPTDIYPEVDRKALAWVYGLSDLSNARYYLIKYVLKNPEFSNRPIFTTYIADDLPRQNEKWFSVPNGLVYQLSADPQTKPSGLVTVDYAQDEAVLSSTMFGRDLLAQYFYSQGAWYARQNNLKSAEENFVKGINFDDQVMGMDQKSFINFRNLYFKP